ncbi:hypothetical protein Patl1_04321 [Pistacia atlantica]|uniref:Uncharacterized protein n=1 Tax=Pistacia atlantica TaxID=434234 RepID=A0ACC1BTP9_9ROSI|nr:hypothetical protein Patl1_04321 [Pistacia atlantica]
MLKNPYDRHRIVHQMLNKTTGAYVFLDFGHEAFIFAGISELLGNRRGTLRSVFQLASTSEATVSIYEFSNFTKIFSGLLCCQSVLNGFVAFFMACNRHCLRCTLIHLPTISGADCVMLMPFQSEGRKLNMNFKAPMASTSTLLHCLSQPSSAHLNHPIPSKLFLHNQLPKTHLSIKCSTTSNNLTPKPDDGKQPQDFPSPSPNSVATTSPESFPIEKRRKSEILRERKSKAGLVKSEPPNFEVGWRRTKEINLEKPIGYEIMDFLEKLQELMERDYGSTTLLEKAGEIVAERAKEEAELLRDEGKVADRMVIELSRVLRLMQMDLAMVKAAVKEETLGERLEQAKARCRQAILIANSF